MKRILVATDGSAGANEAVTEAIELASMLDAELLFVSVEHAPPPPLGVPPYYVVDPDAYKTARAAVEEALEKATDAGVEATGEVLPASADPAHRIVEEARKADVDLIVLGSRGLGTIVGALLGSVSRSVVRHADRPVLVARARVAVS